MCASLLAANQDVNVMLTFVDFLLSADPLSKVFPRKIGTPARSGWSQNSHPAGTMNVRFDVNQLQYSMVSYEHLSET
jgi:hypothetical protein